MLIFRNDKGRIREGGNQEAKPGDFEYLTKDYGIKGAEEDVTDAEYHKLMAEQNAADEAETRARDPYAVKRARAYPSPLILADAEVKLASGDTDLLAEGKAQKAKYVLDCLAVKAAFPKR